MATAATPTLADAVAALRAFADAMWPRRDVWKEEWKIGPPAPAELLAYFRAHPRRLPPELLDLYALMNGCELTWGFYTAPLPPDSASPAEWDQWERDHDYGPQEGHFRLPPLTLETQLRTDHENGYTFFGPAAVSVLIDDMFPGYGTWLVAFGGDGQGEPLPDVASYYPDAPDVDPAAEAAAHANARLDCPQLVFLYDKDQADFINLTLAEYLLQGIACAFVDRWPLHYYWLEDEEGQQLQAVVDRLKAGQ